ncbi:MAG: hypothetical protein WAL29_00220 [Bacteroidales bacterium]
MEAIISVRTKRAARVPGRENSPDYRAYSLLNLINPVLGLIIRNTLQFNKLTSVDEIHGTLIDDGLLDAESDPCVIGDICQILSSDNGVLVTLKSNNRNYYKLKNIY